MTRRINIAGTPIGEGCPPYLIAEMSANHNGNLNNAFEIIAHAKRCGANAVKIQTYTPDTITLKSELPDFLVTDGLWKGKSLYQLYKLAHTPWDWHAQLFEYAKKLDITLFSSPFDSTAVDLLEDLNTPAYKIASFEVIDIPLIKYVASTGKPMIISTGLANLEEIQEAIDTARDSGCNQLAILHCVSGYPTPPGEYNLKTIPDMIARFGLVTGLSDHTLENATAVASTALGASIIEKHFTRDRSQGGADDSFSLEPDEFSTLCRDVNTAWHSLGNIDYSIKSSEAANLKFRRSLYFVKSLRSGDYITADSVRSVRPGYGIAPKFLPDIVGARVVRDVAINSPVTLDDFEPGIL